MNMQQAVGKLKKKRFVRIFDSFNPNFLIFKYNNSGFPGKIDKI